MKIKYVTLVNQQNSSIRKRLLPQKLLRKHQLNYLQNKKK